MLKEFIGDLAVPYTRYCRSYTGAFVDLRLADISRYREHDAVKAIFAKG